MTPVEQPSRSSRLSDTAPAAARVYRGTLRSLGIEGRARLTFQASDAMRSIVVSGIRSRHPEYDDEAVRLAFLRIWLGPGLFRVLHPGVEVAP
jgi:hypothetical protein